MTLSMVVVNYHSAELLRDCLSAVESSWCSGVVIVDNSVDEDEVKRIRDISLDVPLEVIVEDRNIGFGGAANHGVDRALALRPEQPVWLVNPDTRFTVETAAALDHRTRLGLDDILSPVIVTGKAGDLRTWFAGGAVNRTNGDVVHDAYLQPFDQAAAAASRRTTFMCGAAPVFTPRAWSVLRHFRDDLFLYWEDAELSLRAVDEGLVMTVVGDAPPLWHAVGGSGDGPGQSENFYYYSARNRLRVMLQRGAGRALLRPEALVTFVKFVLRPLRRERHRPLRKSALALKGYASALRQWLTVDRARGEVRG